MWNNTGWSKAEAIWTISHLNNVCSLLLKWDESLKYFQFYFNLLVSLKVEFDVDPNGSFIKNWNW